MNVVTCIWMHNGHVCRVCAHIHSCYAPEHMWMAQTHMHA